MYKKLVYLSAIVSLVTVALLFNSCSDTPVVSPGYQSTQLDAGNGCNEPNQFCGSPGLVQIQNSCPGTVNTIDLWAGVGNPDAGVLVGRVEFFQVGTQWKVRYVFTNPNFTATSIHFSIACTLAGIPQTSNGNPRPGQFQYKFNGPFTNPYEFNITLPTGCTNFFAAAHAGGTLGDFNCFNLSIPTGCVNITNMVHGFNGVYQPMSADTGCYWDFNLSNAGTFNGLWCGWCMDLGTTRGAINFNCAHMFSSLAPFPEYLKPFVQGWQDMDKINYLINHFQVGQLVQQKNINCIDSGGTDNITVVDLQKVIWMILDEGPGFQPDWEPLSTSGVRMAIWCDVMAHGEGFVPSCANGDLVAFIIDPGLNPDGSQSQPIFAYAPCCDNPIDVTAWGDAKYGGNFPGPNWATYFKWRTTCP